MLYFYISKEGKTMKNIDIKSAFKAQFNRDTIIRNMKKSETRENNKDESHLKNMDYFYYCGSLSVFKNLELMSNYTYYRYIDIITKAYLTKDLKIKGL